ncbi:lipase member H-A-like [Epargyreus clarus]|uniref:lipase member H-A-like n=1 Tax=Epargyreus clarus TaxID=520877 RepID=UPI003C2B40DE
MSWFWCSFITLGIIHMAYAGTNLRFYLTDEPSLQNYVATPIDKPLAFLSLIKDDKRPITFCAYGLDGKNDGPMTTEVVSTYMTLNNTYVILVDWEKLAATLLTDLEYIVIRENAKKVGVALAKAIYTLVQNGVQLLFRLVAHSLGAIVMAYAGRTFEKLTNYTLKIPRIIHLDPAGPLNNNDEGPKRTDAVFVVAFHTNPGGLGSSESVGHVDFWANCDNNKTQPGCPTNPLQLPNEKSWSCSHGRSWMEFCEALLSSFSYPAACVSTCSDWISQSNPDPQINYLGDNVDPNIPGNCFFSTKSSAPFSKGLEGLKPN